MPPCFPELFCWSLDTFAPFEVETKNFSWWCLYLPVAKSPFIKLFISIVNKKFKSNLVFRRFTPTVHFIWMSCVWRLGGIGRSLHCRHREPDLLLRAREVRCLEVLVRHLDVEGGALDQVAVCLFFKSPPGRRVTEFSLTRPFSIFSNLL